MSFLYGSMGFLKARSDQLKNDGTKSHLPGTIFFFFQKCFCHQFQIGFCMNSQTYSRKFLDVGLGLGFDTFLRFIKLFNSGSWSDQFSWHSGQIFLNKMIQSLDGKIDFFLEYCGMFCIKWILDYCSALNPNIGQPIWGCKQLFLGRNAPFCRKMAQMLLSFLTEGRKKWHFSSAKIFRKAKTLVKKLHRNIFWSIEMLVCPFEVSKFLLSKSYWHPCI
jgi:hypothetical protein